MSLNNTYLARYDLSGMQWQHTGLSAVAAGVAAPPYVTGSLTSSTINIDGIFTLYSSDVSAVNPLPLRFIAFTVGQGTDRYPLLQWQAAGSDTNRFEIERAGEDRSFSVIERVDNAIANNMHCYTDVHALPGINYYRIKLIEPGGGNIYSNIAGWRQEYDAMALGRVYPSPVKDCGMLTVATSKKTDMLINIMDTRGRIIQQFDKQVPAGTSTIQLPVTSLAHGIYLLWGVTKNGKTNLVRVVKE